MTQHTVYIVSQHYLSKHEQDVLQGRAGIASSDNFLSVLAVSPLKYPNGYKFHQLGALREYSLRTVFFKKTRLLRRLILSTS